MKNTLQNTISFLSETSKTLINGCKVKAYDTTTLFTPDGIQSYNALWLRDFSYMTEYAGQFISNEEIIDCINYAIKHRRNDGWMPDRVYADGTSAYAAGEVGSPVGEANLDNTPSLIFTVYTLKQRLSASEFSKLFSAWEPYLCRGLDIIPLDENGLVFNNPEKPHSPYGFTDTIAKSGSLFMESLLYWRACLFMACMTQSPAIKETYLKRCTNIEASISFLYDSQSQMFLAASKDCAQIDIWGNAYMLYIGFPCTQQIKHGILSFLFKHYDRYILHGQIRHLLTDNYWDKLLIHVEKEEYQNGAYWATASGWIIWCLAQIDSTTAARVLYDVSDYIKNKGSFECINKNYQKLPSFVVSAANVLGTAHRLENNEEFLRAYAAIY